jgi:adenosylhomocysteine nucleosidase
MKPLLGMVIAMASEARILVGRGTWKQVKGHLVRHVCLADGTDLIVAHAGVGVENAFTAAHCLISEGATALINLGLAGGLSPSLRAGHLIIAEEVLAIDHENNWIRWKTDEFTVAHARSVFSAENVPVAFGTVTTAKQGILTSDQKELLFKQTHALAVNMESTGIARAALGKNIPFFTMLAICDPAEESVPNALYDCLDKKGHVRPITVLQNLVCNPSLIVDMKRLSRHFSNAKKALENGWRIQIKNNLPGILTSRHQIKQTAF